MMPPASGRTALTRPGTPHTNFPPHPYAQTGQHLAPAKKVPARLQRCSSRLTPSRVPAEPAAADRAVAGPLRGDVQQVRAGCHLPGPGRPAPAGRASALHAHSGDVYWGPGLCTQCLALHNPVRTQSSTGKTARIVAHIYLQQTARYCAASLLPGAPAPLPRVSIQVVPKDLIMPHAPSL